MNDLYWLVELAGKPGEQFHVREYGVGGYLDESTGRLYHKSQLIFIQQVDD